MGLVERIRRVLLIPTWAQWQRWSLTAKLTGVGALVGVLGLALGIYMAIPATVIDAYAVDGSRHDGYLELFRTGQFGQRDKLRIGCVEWSEASCVAAGNFLRLLSEAGWEIDSDTVFRMQPSVPVDGVSIAGRGDDLVGLPKVPPHMGHWSRADVSQEVLIAAFKLMGGPVNFSSDPTLQPGTIGVYFGPKPKLEAPTKQGNEKARRELLSYVGSGMVVQRACSQESSELCAGELFSWEDSVSSFLKQQRFGANAVSHWLTLPQANAVSVTSDMDTKLNVLMSFVLGVE
ncbi:hypothetical protein [Paraburkholderia aspalathi]|uniref:hypothetical protein n=1 Tax=Paraburkholderia aspalathi TaxID=1324617 RepID=UPI00190DFFDD|nr:hypothetical protein [Paraburkholderia aspalathi]